MKSTIAGVLAIAAIANASPSPVEIEARQASSASSSSLPTVTVAGNAFWAGNNRFYIRGVDYQPGGSSDLADPLADVAGCQRDIQYFKQLGINTVRVYTVDNSANHDTCMNALAAAGIYVALDVNTPNYSLNRASPAPSYNPTYLQNVFATMDAFAGYTNTLLFFSGNEVINNITNTNTAPYVKAVGRDMKSYRIARGQRAIPIGYSAADVASNQYETATYMNCGSDDMRSDFFAFNDYSLCDPAGYEGSSWQTKVAQYSNYSIPLFMSEYGCNINTRTFSEVAYLYGSDMTPVYSGGLVYEWSQEANNYGLVSISGSSVSTLPDFTALSTQLAAHPVPTGSGGARNPSSGANACPAADENWDVTNFPGSALPAMPSGAVTFLKNGAGKGVGLTGDGSQNSGGGSSATQSGQVSQTAYVSGGSGTATSTATGAATALKPAGPVGYGALCTVAAVFVSSLLGAALL